MNFLLRYGLVGLGSVIGYKRMTTGDAENNTSKLIRPLVLVGLGAGAYFITKKMRA